MPLGDGLHIRIKDRRFQVFRPDHVRRHQKQLASAQPGRVFADDRRQLAHAAHIGIVRQQKMHHRHEVALARAKASVQKGRFAVAGFQGPANERQRVIETADELVGHHVVFERRCRVFDPLRQTQDKVPFVNALGNFDDGRQKTFHRWASLSDDGFGEKRAHSTTRIGGDGDRFVRQAVGEELARK